MLTPKTNLVPPIQIIDSYHHHSQTPHQEEISIENDGVDSIKGPNNANTDNNSNYKSMRNNTIENNYLSTFENNLISNNIDEQYLVSPLRLHFGETWMNPNHIPRTLPLNLKSENDRKEFMFNLESMIDFLLLVSPSLVSQEKQMKTRIESGTENVTSKSKLNLDIERISGAMTNVIYKVNLMPTRPLQYCLVETQKEEDCNYQRYSNTIHNNKPVLSVLLRVYGQGVDHIISRDDEMKWLTRLSHLRVAPRILATFKNGRIEEYVESDTLNKELLRDPMISKKIAITMAKLHLFVDECPPEEKSESELWSRLKIWFEKSNHSMNCLLSESEKLRISHILPDFNLLKRDILLLESLSVKIGSPLVFSHNDAQYGNILKLKKDRSLVIVDYEYSGINYRGFDIANHFCEWAADYHSQNPHLMNFDLYPTEKQQINFLRPYLNIFEPNTLNNPELFELEIIQILKEISFFSLTSHLLWGFWGIIQGAQSTIDFDYIGYSIQRFKKYLDTKDDILNLSLN